MPPTATAQHLPTDDDHSPATKSFVRTQVSDLRSEMVDRFAEQNTKFAKLDAKVDSGFAEQNTKFAELDAKIDRRFADLHRWFTTVALTTVGLLITSIAVATAVLGASVT